MQPPIDEFEDKFNRLSSDQREVARLKHIEKVRTRIQNGERHIPRDEYIQLLILNGYSAEVIELARRDKNPIVLIDEHGNSVV